MSCPSLFAWSSAALSHVGLVRARNEDACLAAPERGLWAVADGMGGHAVGDYASQAVVAALGELAEPASLEAYVAAARERLQGVNRQLRAEAASRNVQRIGSTVAVLLACGGRCACLWAGDSRIYLCREARLTQLTRDHSQAEELRALGRAPLDAAARPARNLITRAVGAVDTLDVDEVTVDVCDGDIFLLCSDGLSNPVSADEIAAELTRGDGQQAVQALVELALRRGGRDNISAVVVHAEDLYNSDKTLLNPAL